MARLLLAFVLFVFIQAVLGWKVKIYQDHDCEFAKDKPEHYLFEGEGELDYCVSPGAFEFPDGVSCLYFNGKHENSTEPCRGQFKTFLSWTQSGADMRVWRRYDETKSVRQRCSKSTKWYGEDKKGNCYNSRHMSYRSKSLEGFRVKLPGRIRRYDD